MPDALVPVVGVVLGLGALVSGMMVFASGYPYRRRTQDGPRCELCGGRINWRYVGTRRCWECKGRR